MNEKYYTVEQISEMLNMHPKTIQRYIREGKLKASKVGKGWRVTGHDLSVFTGGSEREPVRRSGFDGDERKITVSSVVDIEVLDHSEALRIVNTVTALMNSKPSEYGRSKMTTQYIESEGTVRIMITASLRVMEIMLASIAALTSED